MYLRAKSRRESFVALVGGIKRFRVLSRMPRYLHGGAEASKEIDSSPQGLELGKERCLHCVFLPQYDERSFSLHGAALWDGSSLQTPMSLHLRPCSLVTSRG